MHFITFNLSLAILYRFDNEIIFEEKKVEDRMPTDPAALILEKDGNYWLYHKGVIEDFEQERLQPSSKAWLIVKYARNETGSFINKVTKCTDACKCRGIRYALVILSSSAGSGSRSLCLTIALMESRYTRLLSSRRE